MQSLVIEPQKEGKGRSFSASLLAFATADGLWEGGRTESNATRPVFLAYAASEGESAPFLANLRLGRRAKMASSGYRRKDPYIELLRSAEYVFSTQRFREGVVVTAYLQELFRVDPGMVDPATVQFVILPPKERILTEAKSFDLASVFSHVRKLGFVSSKEYDTFPSGMRKPSEGEVLALLPLSSLFAVFLDRRTRAPLIPDPRFHAQLLLTCLALGYASTSCEHTYRTDFGKNPSLGFLESTVENVNLSPGVAFKATHDKLEPVLAETVSTYFKAVK